MRISVVIPTISGREDSLARVMVAYRERTPGHKIQVVTPRNYSCWPEGCNAGFLDTTGDVIHYGADDLEPLDGWADAMLATLEQGEIPAPQLWDYKRTPTSPVNEGDGPPGSVTEFSRVPALTRDMAERVGPWPIMDYYADNWVSDKARTFGVLTRVTAGYEFVHHWNQVGRLDAGDWVGRSRPAYEAALRAL